MTSARIVLLGGGGHARVVLDVLRLLGREVLGFTAPSSSELASVRHLGDDDALAALDPAAVELVNCVGSTGSTALRAGVYERAAARGLSFATIVHPRAIVAGDVELGPGCQIMAGAVVQPGARLAEDVLVNTGALVDHDCAIAAHAHVAPGATLSGEVRVGRGVHIGAGAVVRQGVSVGDGAVVGAGAVVVNDVAAGSTVVGVPARPRSERRS